LFGKWYIGQIAKWSRGPPGNREFREWDTIIIPENDGISFNFAVQLMHCMIGFDDWIKADIFVQS
jgi:hypothetical protein